MQVNVKIHALLHAVMIVVENAQVDARSHVLDVLRNAQVDARSHVHPLVKILVLEIYLPRT